MAKNKTDLKIEEHLAAREKELEQTRQQIALYRDQLNIWSERELKIDGMVEQLKELQE